jgi:hypothetical protein
MSDENNSSDNYYTATVNVEDELKKVKIIDVSGFEQSENVNRDKI